MSSNDHPSPTRILVVLATIALTTGLTACSSSETTTVDTAADTTATTSATETVATTQPEQPATTAPVATETTTGQPTPGGDSSSAIVTIGDETYTFATTGFAVETCDPSFFGGAQIILQGVDADGEPVMVGQTIKPLQIVLIPDDSANSVVVPTAEADVEWIADAESTEVQGTAIDEWTISGNSVQGTATFASTAGDGPVQGTFEVTCADGE